MSVRIIKLSGIMRAFAFLLFSLMGRASAAAYDPKYWQAYEHGDLGFFPQQTFYSAESISAPLVHVARSHPHCDQSSSILLSPRGKDVRGNKAVILDSSGNLVWSHTEVGAVNSLQVQKFRGRPFLTYWVGDDTLPGFGRGYYKMVDQTYTLSYVVRAAGNIDGDYHEFTITPDNTALITAYVKIPRDLSVFGGKSAGFIWDCLFQEIEIETGNLLFEWHASDHFSFENMTTNSWIYWTGSEESPWDWFHINSVEKDLKGNYLVSARYTNALTYIDGKTGSILWNLGGDMNNFEFLPDGEPIELVDPHMARWSTKDRSSITVFDNVDFWTNEDNESRSHALKIHVDVKRMRAKRVVQFENPDQIIPTSHGSIHDLANGNYFVSYGSVPVFTEFSSNGTLLCDSHYSPTYTGKQGRSISRFAHNYRVYKQRWVGTPSEPAMTTIGNDTLFISWNGATEVDSWMLEGRIRTRTGVDSLRPIRTLKKSGFETNIRLGNTRYPSYRLTALTVKGKAIQSWHVSSTGKVMDTSHDDLFQVMQSLYRQLGNQIIIILSCGVLYVLYKRRISSFQESVKYVILKVRGPSISKAGLRDSTTISTRSFAPNHFN